MRIHRIDFDLDSYKIRRNESFSRRCRRTKAKQQLLLHTMFVSRFMFIVTTFSVSHACMLVIDYSWCVVVLGSVGLGVFVCECVRIRIFFIVSFFFFFNIFIHMCVCLLPQQVQELLTLGVSIFLRWASVESIVHLQSLSYPITAECIVCL